MGDSSSKDPFPGIRYAGSLRPGAPAEIFAVAWSPDGSVLATGSKDKRIRLWKGGAQIASLEGHVGTVLSVAFSPTMPWLASSSVDRSIRIWDIHTQSCFRRLEGHAGRVTSLAWSGDGTLLVSGSDDGTLRCWPSAAVASERLIGHAGLVNCVAISSRSTVVASAAFDRTARLWDVAFVRGTWGFPLLRRQLVLQHPGCVNAVCFSPDDRVVATAGDDAAIRIWEVSSGILLRVLEGHTTPVRAIAFSPDGRWFVSKSEGGSVRLWRCDLWQQLGSLPEQTTSLILSIGFSRDNVLATFGDRQQSIRLWRLDPRVLLAGSTLREQYCNAKVVLVGDSGVGKSGLALALIGRPFSATESTHARSVWQLDERVVDLAPDLRETRELLLWDLAGQPGYRLVHQLHLHDTTVAIIVFDARSDTDPFAGVRYWDRALRQARRGQAPHGAPLRKILVVARVDRGGVGAGAARLAQLRTELGVRDEDFFETSAKEGWGIAELRDALHRLVDWDHLPKVTSTRLFHDIRSFVISARGGARRLLAIASLAEEFLRVASSSPRPDAIMNQFEACVGRLESSGVIRKLSFGDYILLEPEILDAYASAIVEAARDEPDGLGAIGEDDVRRGSFRMPASRLANRYEEEVLLIATIESLVHGEIALREATDRGVVLIFPSQSTRDPPPEVARLRPSHRVAFEGSARSVYATLAVRLARSGVFKREDLWRDGLIVTDSLGARCGVRLQTIGETGGELEVLISPETARAIRAQLEQFVHAHVLQRAIAASVRAEPVLTCGCGEVFQPAQIRKRVELQKPWITCPVCEQRTPLGGANEPLAAPEAVIGMDRQADRGRDADAATLRIQGKQRTKDFDVFLCHNSRDKAEVKQIGKQLQALGYLPWLDEWEIVPGMPCSPQLEAQLESIRSAAVFLGADGFGPWQNLEMRALLIQFLKRGCPVIPVILPSMEQALPALPPFLQDFAWVDFRLDDPEPLERLIWGITKVKPRPADT